jgi:general secretion pathway protein H
VRGSSGSTLIEVLLALGLAAVLAGIAVASLPALTDGIRVAGAARLVASTLRLIRGRALAGEGPLEVRFAVARAALEVGPPGAPARDLVPLPAGVRFARVPARGRLRFGALGTTANGTVTLAAGGRRRQVVVNQRGRVRAP